MTQALPHGHNPAGTSCCGQLLGVPSKEQGLWHCAAWQDGVLPPTKPLWINVPMDKAKLSQDRGVPTPVLLEDPDTVMSWEMETKAS